MMTQVLCGGPKTYTEQRFSILGDRCSGLSVTLTEQHALSRFPEILDQPLNWLSSAFQLNAEAVDAQEILGIARDQLQVNRHIIRHQRNTALSAGSVHAHTLLFFLVSIPVSPARSDSHGLEQPEQIFL